MLLTLKRLTTLDKVRIVLGNEACDLDSAVSSHVYAYLQNCVAHTNPSLGMALPVLNIIKEDFDLKTEVIYFFKKCGVPVEDLLFRDTIDLNVLQSKGSLELILVDHHSLSEDDLLLKPHVIEVIDHRPLDPDWVWENTKKKIEEVGSCSTLIAEAALNQSVYTVPQEILFLLYGTIILDTACVSDNPKKYTAKDLQIIEKLEELLIQKPSRATLYKELLTARSDISNLSVLQVLKKDLKVVCGVPISTVPMLIKEFLDLNGAKTELQSFARASQYKIVIILGVSSLEGNYRRELALYAEDPHVSALFSEALTSSKCPQLELEKIETNWNIKELIVFNQRNTQASRKQIVPIVKKAVPTLPGFCESEN